MIATDIVLVLECEGWVPCLNTVRKSPRLEATKAGTFPSLPIPHLHHPQRREIVLSVTIAISLPIFGSFSISTLQKAIVSLEELTRSGEAQYNEAKDGVFSDAIKKASSFEKDFVKSATTLRDSAEKLAEKVWHC